jgi:hypothetical protein
MDYQYALAFASASDALCFFTGAGFSKHLSGGASPSWIELLERSCDSLADPAHAKAQLAQAVSTYPLEDCAQILEIAFTREGKDLKEVLGQLISATPLEKRSAAAVRGFFESNVNTSVVTTNYDQLLEDALEEIPFVSNYPGKPISRKAGAVQIFHIHGSVESPSSLVATTNDYYKFINEEGYFSQKTLTLMHESSVVILGYSLSDPNLKAILSDLKYHGLRSINRGNIFYVTRGVVPAFVRDYYEAAFGLVVVENTEIDYFLQQIQAKIPNAKTQVKETEQNIKDVIAGRKHWTDAFLKLPTSLFQIFASANVNGVEIGSEGFVAMLQIILERKTRFTGITGAWEQYSHLADWLVHIGAVLDIRGRSIETAYLTAVKHSMGSMSKAYKPGKSWYAYSVWHEKWKFLSFDNRLLIRQYVFQEMVGNQDAVAVVSQ